MTIQEVTIPVPDRAATRSVADVLEPLFEVMLDGPPPVRFEFWDGSALGADDGTGTLRVNSPNAIRQLVWSPGELGVSRAFVAGDIDVLGPLVNVLHALRRSVRAWSRYAVIAAPRLLAAIRELGIDITVRPPPPPSEEIRPRGIRHSISRDKVAVSHHYDVGNSFYRLVLGPAMTYSCARFESGDSTLKEAQDAKHELICRKLGLDKPVFRDSCAGERPRLLDVGCGWGSMAIHAARHHDVDVVAVTISDEQAAEARRRVEDAGLGDRVEIHTQDYREVGDGPYDAISSIGMAEHVGLKNLPKYFGQLHTLLRPGGRLLNHAIASIGGSHFSRRQFLHRYVFPDGELIDVGVSAIKMQQAGFELRDVENLREHYARTLIHWVANLEANWAEAVDLVGEGRARVWLLYMSGSINGFDENRIQIHQTLGVRPFPHGRSGMPLTRDEWARPSLRGGCATRG
jgi:cyclopropane-fatty-acyl-phospholipid synthase